MKIISKQQAKEQGLSFYFTGNPCKHGHLSKRYTKNAICVQCAREKSAQKRLKNPDAHRALMQKYYHKNADKLKAKKKERYHQSPETFRSAMRSFRKKNPHRVLEIRKRYYKKNAEKVKQAASVYRLENPEKTKEWSRQYRARRANAEGSHTQSDINCLYSHQKGRCVGCGSSISDGYHVDHIIPLSKGGTDYPDNIQLLCPSCNCSKQDKCPIEWAQQNGKLL